MNSSTRDQIFAAKERLHKLTEKAREEEERRAAQSNVEKEKARLTARAQEEAAHLRKHNKTVKQVLSQAAKLSREGGANDTEGADDSDSDEEEEESETDEQEEHQAAGQGEEKGGPASGQHLQKRELSKSFILQFSLE